MLDEAWSHSNMLDEAWRHSNMLDEAWSHSNMLGEAWSHSNMLDEAWSHSNMLDEAWSHSNMLDEAWSHSNMLDEAWSHSNMLDEAWSHLDIFIKWSRCRVYAYATHSGTWKSSITAILCLFLLLGVILTQNPLDASLASMNNLFYSHFKNDVSEHKTLHFWKPLKNNYSHYITNTCICPILNIF